MTSKINGCNTQGVSPIKQYFLLEEGLPILESIGDYLPIKPIIYSRWRLFSLDDDPTLIMWLILQYFH
jgi:hypothetical protein